MLRLFFLLLSTLMFVPISVVTAAEQEHSSASEKASTAPMRYADESGSGGNYYCRVSDMPISWRTNGHPVQIAHSDAVFTGLGTTTPGLDVRNTQAASITNLALVVEYVDEEGHTVATATAAGAAPGFEKAIRTPFPVEEVKAWKQPLDPGQTERIDGFNAGARTITCPVAARVTFAIVRFKSGTVQQYASAGWRVGPLPRIVPELISACPPVQSGLVEIPAKLRISAAGDVLGIAADTRNYLTVLGWITAQVGQWKFHPALIDGQPKDSEVDLEFVVHGSAEPNLSAISSSAPAILIQFFPARDSAPRCVESFAQLTEGATIP